MQRCVSHTHVYIYTYMNMYTYINNSYINNYMCVFVYIRIYIYMYTNMRTNIYIYVHVHIYIHIYIHMQMCAIWDMAWHDACICSVYMCDMTHLYAWYDWGQVDGQMSHVVHEIVIVYDNMNTKEMPHPHVAHMGDLYCHTQIRMSHVVHEIPHSHLTHMSVCVWQYESLIRVTCEWGISWTTRLIRICVWQYKSLICATCEWGISHTPDSYGHGSHISVIHIVMLRTPVRAAIVSLICVTHDVTSGYCQIHTWMSHVALTCIWRYDSCHSYVWHEWCICVIWITHMCDTWQY